MVTAIREEADRLAKTGEYVKAAKIYRDLGLTAQAAYYEAQSKIKRS